MDCVEYGAAQNVIIAWWGKLPERTPSICKFFKDNPNVNILISRPDEMTQVSAESGSLSWLRFLMKDLEYAILDLYTQNGKHANSSILACSCEILSFMYEGEAAQIALENKQDCVCIQATKEDADKIIYLLNIQLEKENNSTESGVEK